MMASKNFQNKASEVGKLWSVATKCPHTDQTSLLMAIYGPKRDWTSSQISHFPSAKGSDISQFWDPFLSTYGWDILQSIPGSCLEVWSGLLTPLPFFFYFLFILFFYHNFFSCCSNYEDFYSTHIGHITKNPLFMLQ